MTGPVEEKFDYSTKDSRTITNPALYMDMLIFITTLPRSMWSNKAELMRRYEAYCIKNEMTPPPMRTMDRWMRSRNTIKGIDGQWTMLQLVDRYIKGDLDLEEAFKRAGVPTGSIRPDVLAMGSLQEGIKLLRATLKDPVKMDDIRAKDPNLEVRMFRRLESMCEKLASLEARTAAGWPDDEEQALKMVGNLLDQFPVIRSTVKRALNMEEGNEA